VAFLFQIASYAKMAKIASNALVKNILFAMGNVSFVLNQVRTAKPVMELINARLA
jgi:hypothetical protein